MISGGQFRRMAARLSWIFSSPGSSCGRLHRRELRGFGRRLDGPRQFDDRSRRFGGRRRFDDRSRWLDGRRRLMTGSGVLGTGPCSPRPWRAHSVSQSMTIFCGSGVISACSWHHRQNGAAEPPAWEADGFDGVNRNRRQIASASRAGAGAGSRETATRAGTRQSGAASATQGASDAFAIGANSGIGAISATGAGSTGGTAVQLGQRQRRELAELRELPKRHRGNWRQLLRPAGSVTGAGASITGGGPRITGPAVCSAVGFNSTAFGGVAGSAKTMGGDGGCAATGTIGSTTDGTTIGSAFRASTDSMGLVTGGSSAVVIERAIFSTSEVFGSDRSKPICSTSFCKGSRTSVSSSRLISLTKISGANCAMRDSGTAARPRAMSDERSLILKRSSRFASCAPGFR